MGLHHGQILRILRDEGPQSRAILARRSKLSATTLTHVTAQLLNEGDVAEEEPVGSSGVGRPGQAIRLLPDARHVAGVHVGAGLVQLAITNPMGAPKAAASFDFDLPLASPEAILARIAGEIRTLQASSGIERILGVGLGVPGPVDTDQRTILTSINTGWCNVPLADMLQQQTGLPVILEHNVTAMAIAEARFGLGRKVPGTLFVYLRSGLGAGLVIDGMPFRPGGHGAVELGHIQISNDGPRCSCGNHGCLECYLNERVLTQSLGLEGPAPTDLLARMEKTAGWVPVLNRLTDSLAIAITLLTPDLIVFGGHLGEAPESLFAHLRQHLPPRVMPHMRDILRFERTSFGAQSGAFGGAAVALDHFFYSGDRH
jgi:predicted NBD/HSP70 family sugar kinase